MIEAKHKLSIKESLELIESLILVADEQMIDKIKKAIKNREDELIFDLSQIDIQENSDKLFILGELRSPITPPYGCVASSVALVDPSIISPKAKQK